MSLLRCSIAVVLFVIVCVYVSSVVCGVCSVEDQVASVNKTLTSFIQRWQALKPKELATWAPAEVERVFTSLAEWDDNLTDIRTQVERLKDNCVNFMVGALSLSFL
jgi:predicted PurR-regulated permease PerM